MKKGDLWQNFLRALSRCLIFFLLVALLVTCTMVLFVNTLADDLALNLTGDNLNRAAKLTLLAVLLLSLLITAVDTVRRKITTERITRRIVAATQELVNGNFDTRIPTVGKFGLDESYGQIIDCFNEMARELGSVETLRSDFIANVSHEMKTPLAVMQNYATLLRAPSLSDEKRLEYAAGIAAASRRTSEMISNILKLNRLENQRIYPNAAPFDLGEHICENLLQYESVWEEKNIAVDTALADDVIVTADAELLGLVWSNLFSNAFKFTPDGGTVRVEMTADAHFASVCVRDSGCGMSAEVGAHIFEKFYQGETSHASQGNGLGLALVKRVVDILKGEIRVESTLGVGSTFTVRIRRG